MINHQLSNPAEIGPRLKQTRIKAGLTMGQVVQRGGLFDTSHYSKIENYTNGQTPTVDTILKISKVFPNLNLHWFLTGQGLPEF